MEPTFLSPLWYVTILVIAVAFLFFYLYYKKGDTKQPSHKSYLDALRFIAENDKRRAVEMLKQAVRDDTTNIDAYTKLGDLLREEGLHYNATRIHKDLTLRGNLSEEEQEKVNYSLALDYWDADKKDKAEVFFSKLIKSKFYGPKVVDYLVEIYEARADYKAAFDVLKNISSSDQKARLALFKVLEGKQLAEEKEARVKYKEALKYDSGLAVAYASLGDSYITEERLDDAIGIWTEFCKKYPSKSSVLFPRLEKAWFDKGQFSKTEELYTSILKNDPENRAALLALIRYKSKKGEYDDALALIEGHPRLSEEDNVIQAEAVRILFEKNQYKEASKKALELLDQSFSGPSFLYTCHNCDHHSEEAFWKCPKCNTLQLEN